MKIKMVLPLVLVALLLIASFSTIRFTEVDAEPTRSNPLYQLTENYNWSFSKPAFFDDSDPNYNGHTNLKENDWDDVAIVIALQDKHTTKVRENSNPSGNQVDCADIYQTMFIPLNGTTISSGTDQTILVEDFTATWCIYCTGVVGAMQRLDHDEDWWPEKYIGIEWHSGGGDYGTGTPLSTATSRRSEYNLAGGIPRYVIDGMVPYVGGSSSANATAIDARLKSDINTRGASASPITISAVGGHSSSSAWVDFEIEVVDPNFDNALVEAYAFLVQDAYPRRHGANSDAFLGWIGQDSKSQRIFNIDSNVPVISDITPAEGSVLQGDVTIDFTVTDPDADDSKITNYVYIRKKGASDWTRITPTNGDYIWKTAEKLGSNYIYEDGDYQIKIYSKDYWWDEAEHIFDVSIRNPDPPLVNIIEEDMLPQINLEGRVKGVFNIYWEMSDDEDDSGLVVDIMYKSRNEIEWTPVVEGLVDITSYSWDTMNPRVPDDENYKLKIIVTDTDGMIAEAEGSSDLRFEINNPDPPEVEIQYPPEGKELSGTSSIRWLASDDEDSSQMLKADIFISNNGGDSFEQIGINRPNSGTFSFDTTKYPDGIDYVAKVRIRDTDGMQVEALTPTFSIYNNDRPEVNLINPAQDDTVSGEIEIKWIATDQEDPEEDLLFDLYYMSESDSYWKTITLDEFNTGSYMWDTTTLPEGDGIVTIKIVIKDTRNLESDAVTRYFNIYNPDAPVITNPEGPTGPVESLTTLTWLATDPDPLETDQLKIWLFYRSGDSEWQGVENAQGIPNMNRHQIDVSEWEDGVYDVKLVVYDCQEGDNNRSAEFIFMDIVVDNNDPPTVSLIDLPAPESNNTGEIALSWEGSDPEGKGVSYTLYYRSAADDNWIRIPGAMKLTTTSFIWNISDLETGDYEIMIVAQDGSREKLTHEITSSVFTIWNPTEDETPPDDDDQQTLIPEDDSNDNSSSSLIIFILVIGVILFLVLIVAGLLIIKKNNAAQNMPPPGGFPPGGPPQVPSSEQSNLPDSFKSGHLPQGSGAENTLPPANNQQEPPKQ